MAALFFYSVVAKNRDYFSNPAFSLAISFSYALV
jgi:hypothetical protein